MYFWEILLGSIFGNLIGWFIVFRPLTNTLSKKIHRNMMKRISKAEDAFAKRTQP